MVYITSLGKKLSNQEINAFEIEHNLSLPFKYKQFMLENNGAIIEPSVFQISEDKGESVLSALFAIDRNLKRNVLEKYIFIYDGRIPEEFLPIGKDPGGHVICVNNDDHIYFWDHEEETSQPNDLNNMYLLAENIYMFVDSLYEDEEV
ncbi:SMI1/KNR4 family protein [Priestia megaterium]|uniref:SMI1/KNR4 family protein n=1 Tax=Priestia megaterium TaxID=1404 RepID=UPI000BF44B54|nr:SMI1/KNR4 family protein [Priestia megaterium]PFK02367.1 SMI1/KNR4 family protein [Priestia megaterium]PMD07767.1 SMI1/KNR4 family protein [Priestia megaterium]